jgi:hypothetical protein
MGLRDGSELAMMLLCRMNRTELGHIEDDDGAVSVRGREHERLSVRRPANR